MKDYSLLSDLPELIITDHDTCGQVLSKGGCYDDEQDMDIVGPFANVVSIVGTWTGAEGEDLSEPPGGWAVWKSYEANKLRLQFDDVPYTNPHGDAPTHAQVQEILDFADTLDGGRTIIHCAAGVSRSSGACLAIIMKLLGKGYEELAVHHVSNVKSSIRPHRGLTFRVDELMGLEGKLVEAHKKVWGPGDGGFR